MLESIIVNSALSFFGHVVRTDVMDLQIMLGEWKVGEEVVDQFTLGSIIYKNISLKISRISY